MKLVIHPSVLQGHITPPPAKSITHRAFICAAFAGEKSRIHNPLLSSDTTETIEVLKRMGCEFTFFENGVDIDGSRIVPEKHKCFKIPESASTLRMLLPLMLCFYEDVAIKTTPRMLERIQTPDLAALGWDFEFLPEKILVRRGEGQKQYFLSTNLTTQWLSGMILALPFLPENTIVSSDHPLLEDPYPHLTIKTAKDFGSEYAINKNTLSLKKPGSYRGRDYTIEADYSSAVIWLGASYLHPKLSVSDLEPRSCQADAAFFAVMKALGVHYHRKKDFAYKSGKIRSGSIDISKTPDLFPILVAIASLGEGRVEFRGLEKLQYKESNRIQAMVNGINRLGGNIKMTDAGLIVHGVRELKGGTELETFNDHRIIMAFAILASKCKKPCILDDFTGVQKSYPDFFNEYQRMGGKVEVI
jgi:3-phosphoshikimate 1-carboxyvinyltransferase